MNMNGKRLLVCQRQNTSANEDPYFHRLERLIYCIAKNLSLIFKIWGGFSVKLVQIQKN
jgi:hypothetical protein